MFITSIVVDGFKSYGQRTVIGPFDPGFNAITGLNGSGKSNILDAICFVLGITNLSQVRVTRLQDLIYKSGQSGIKKATVSLVFDNSNRQQSPPGFEEFDEITITRQVEMGGKAKYFLNGHGAQDKKVHDLFCSVQLNVNNPNFLVMQGKITKVLNMKPVEILSMIEEAAGTHMYQKKRDECVRHMEKKNSKLQELIDVISTDVRPNLEKLRKERAQYDEYRELEHETERMMRLFEAWQFYLAQKKTATSKSEMEKSQSQVEGLEKQIQEHHESIKTIEKQIEERNANDEEASKSAELENELKEREKLEAKTNAAEKAAKDALIEEEKQKKQLEQRIKTNEKDYTNQQTELNKVKTMFEQLKHDDEVDNEAFAASQRKYEAVCAGMEINDEGKTETLQQQLINTRSIVAQAQCEHKEATMRLAHSRELLQKKERELGALDPNQGGHQVKIEQLQREIKGLESAITKLNYDEEQLKQLQQRHRELSQQSQPIRERINNFVIKCPYSTFRYTDPRPNFDKSKVYGPICRLIQLKDQSNAFPLEIAAGGRLYEVVVDNDSVSKLLINHGNLQYRTTFVPMNKIKGYRIPASVVQFAQNLVGAENVTTAISLINYNRKFETVMEYAFGSVLICKDFNTAKRVAFHERIKRKCVTLDGDVVDPAGVFEGGSIPNEQPILNRITDTVALEKQLMTIEEELRTIDGQIEQMQQKHERWSKLNGQLQVKKYELEMLEQAMQISSYYMLQQEVQSLKQEIVSLTEKLKETEETERKLQAKIKELETNVKDLKGYRQQQVKQVEKEMEQLQQKAQKSRENWRKHEQHYETLVLEISELKKENEELKEQILGIDQNLVELKEKYEVAKAEADANRKEVSRLQNELKALKQANAEKNRKLQKQMQEKERLLAEISEMELRLKKLKLEMNKREDAYKMSTAKEKEYKKKCCDENVLKEAEALTEQEGSKLEERLRHAQDRMNVLRRSVNSKAQTMFEDHERKYNEILNKIRILESDKKKIEQAIVKMDQRKEETILKAHQQVTRDFGSIFGTLLPGANAELKPAPGKTVLDGLEVKVSLGGVWKDNLSELSGGQRSLAALSLILAILLFKPAPLYILDEVDAALDLSHTQNIGNMLKTHFKQSQFIIVSLQDGMFNNANVLFRTQFIDGVSSVSRTTSS